MSDRKLNDVEVVDVIEQEGVWYAVRDYLSEEDIENPKTAELWKVARLALNVLSQYLKLDD